MVIVHNCMGCKYCPPNNKIMNTPCYKCKFGSEYKPNIDTYYTYSTSTSSVEGARPTIYAKELNKLIRDIRWP